MKNLPRLGVLLFLIFALLGSTPAAAGKGYPWMPGYRKPVEPVFPEILLSPAEAENLLEAGKLAALDLRSPDAYARGHLPGARLLPPSALAADRARERQAKLFGELGLRGDETLLLYSGNAGHEAIGLAFWRLERAGFPPPRILDGGIAAWREEGLPLPAESVRFEPLGFPAEFADSLAIDSEYLNERYGRSGTEILDLRGADAWSRAEAPDGERAGHIPHALPYDFSRLLPEEGWPDPAEARREFGRLGPRERDFVDLEAEFILYGEDHGDTRVGLAWLLLRMMDIRARVFASGWRAWQADRARPVVRILPTEELAARMEAENPGLAADKPYDSLILLDLRGNRDWRRSHLPGALALPAHVFSDSLDVLLEKHWPGLEQGDASMVLYCYGPACVRSRNGASKAAHAGFLDLLWYRDGVEGWQAAELPLTQRVSP